ncbi:Plasmid stabilization system protein ParE [Treponema bryantii]|uniref:Plasmid stabilization system protein ParE n=1 Tax=Treponema bryantii TaxID=163 RepID=A0A1H9GQ05_9SPIR|nr:type II toxin-antitoxin system RelE/ParE family toxin [Treponema bryantii]SEQ52192.1 Plasmid stabilization system protein ParE [Treponema bryantii]
MNNFKVSYTKKAEADLDRIYDFVANEYHNLNAAVRLLQQLTKAVDDLSFMADSYHHFQEEPYLSEGIRYFSEGKYSVFYKIIDDTAYVIRIVPGAIDLLKALSEIV